MLEPGTNILTEQAQDADRLRAQVRELTRERDEVRRLRLGLATIRADYPAAAQAVNVILWPAVSEMEGGTRG